MRRTLGALKRCALESRGGIEGRREAVGENKRRHKAWQKGWCWRRCDWEISGSGEGCFGATRVGCKRPVGGDGRKNQGRAVVFAMAQSASRLLWCAVVDSGLELFGQKLSSTGDDAGLAPWGSCRCCRCCRWWPERLQPPPNHGGSNRAHLNLAARIDRITKLTELQTTHATSPIPRTGPSTQSPWQRGSRCMYSPPCAAPRGRQLGPPSPPPRPPPTASSPLLGTGLADSRTPRARPQLQPAGPLRHHPATRLDPQGQGDRCQLRPAAVRCLLHRRPLQGLQ